jgi:hypothetical protein
MPELNETQIENWFQYHAPNANQSAKYEAIRKAARELALTIFKNTPAGADQSDAIRSVRNSAMTANQAIAVELGGSGGASAGR